MSGTLRVSGIYPNLKSQSPIAELPCVFMRHKGCGLHFSLCDTTFAFSNYIWSKEQFPEIHDRRMVLFLKVNPLSTQQQNDVLKSTSISHTTLTQRALPETIIADCLPVRSQLQQHKRIFPLGHRGVK